MASSPAARARLLLAELSATLDELDAASAPVRPKRVAKRTPPERKPRPEAIAKMGRLLRRKGIAP